MWSIFPYENSNIDTTSEDINGISCLKFRPRGYEGLLPTVIYYHGWHSSKDFKRFEAMIIASNGYQVIVPDALYHGDRSPIDHDNPLNLYKYLWEIILQNVKESKTLIEEIVNRHGADPLRIGIIGESMGAVSAGGVFVDNQNLKCLVGINGTFAWQETISKNCLPKVSNEYSELIEYYDPINNTEKIKERAVLMLHGTGDTTLPVDSQRLFFNEIFPLYSNCPEKLELAEALKVDHSITTGMLEKAIMWFKEQL